MKRIILVVFCILLGIVGCCVLMDRRPTALEKAREVVKVGDLRQDAIIALVDDAWYYQPCNGVSTEATTDLFFFGSHRYDKAEIVIVDSRLEREVFRVDQVSGFEPYLWHSVYCDCIDPSLFEDYPEPAPCLR